MRGIFYILLFSVLQSCTDPASENHGRALSISSLNTINSYDAGDDIALSFETTGSVIPDLVVKNAFGISVVKGKKENNKLLYVLPNKFSEKAGICDWKLVHNKGIYSEGILNIKPKLNSTNHLETYLGPRNINAVDSDFSMLVVVPTDCYDNPLPIGVSIDLKHQFDNSISYDSAETENLIAWKKIYATHKSGKILTSTSYKTTYSAEMTTTVYPGTAVDFEIGYERNHKYADGNQIINFETSIIKDQFNNIVSDGTMVTFLIEDANGKLLNTMGNTIMGIANAKMLHPEEENHWSVKAYITGAATSNLLSIDFEAAVKDYDVHFSKDNRTVTIGPIIGFLDQWIPDGINIQLYVEGLNNGIQETLKTTSRKGKCVFRLDSEFYNTGTYTIEIKAAGIIKKQTITLLDEQLE